MSTRRRNCARWRTAPIDADARLDLEDFKEETGIALAPADPEEEVDTLGGLVVSLLGPRAAARRDRALSRRL